MKSRFHKTKEERGSVLGGESNVSTRTAPSSFRAAFSLVTKQVEPGQRGSVVER